MSTREGRGRERGGRRKRGGERGTEEKESERLTNRSTLNLCHQLRIWCATDLQDSVEVITIWYILSQESHYQQH